MREKLTDKNPCENYTIYSPCTSPCRKWREWYQSVLEKLKYYEDKESACDGL